MSQTTKTNTFAWERPSIHQGGCAKLQDVPSQGLQVRTPSKGGFSQVARAARAWRKCQWQGVLGVASYNPPVKVCLGVDNQIPPMRGWGCANLQGVPGGGGGWESRSPSQGCGAAKLPGALMGGGGRAGRDGRLDGGGLGRWSFLRRWVCVAAQTG